ncbi:bifunctional pyridoxamine 5'-phosphate oxidase family protein/GNAT family N-acetyltransferase [Cryptosporangium aurantiacum]|uniref:Nitroimidazol reductase NimA, pyridoxamine 5'-phosphate oxidase superfamily n=1 Tax=Cryptosporangium aurantiacum TaxID=134849 RepID=A0A1M7IV18_9ACTN|nr:bifunctional pyridoxamine 5'-phosphate oxidase family protein/GNAT family N-acetyltransferase [Cryptosporangium aurantiacum]SHM44503.1 Nitroimidazol reductase NimA, pyridoxamine 5'-phosphate oxidase superfamily [Cryptosporangium aurantiacum]
MGAPSARTVPTRYADRARYDRETIHAILDEALVAHLGIVIDGAPRVIPTLHARVDDTLYLHGSTGSRPLREADDGVPVCVTVTLIDGLVFARSGFNHSVDYRSVIVHGLARPVRDRDEKLRALDALLEQAAPGRAADCRPPSNKELAATAVLAIPLSEASAKIGDRLVPGAVVEEEPEDYGLAYWAGFLPMRTVAGPPVASADLGPTPTPHYLSAYRRGSVPRDTWHRAPVLEGQFVRLEPLGLQHVEDLLATASDPEVHEHIPHPVPSTIEEMTRFVEVALADAERGERVPFAQVDAVTGRAIGSTSYYEIEPSRPSLAIGYTFLGRDWWRSGVNTEAKLLLLGHAFETLGAERVTWHTDILNLRSQAAIERLGAVREGVLRRHKQRQDGSWRDTVLYGMTSTEWPTHRDRLRARLTNP